MVDRQPTLRRDGGKPRSGHGSRPGLRGAWPALAGLALVGAGATPGRAGAPDRGDGGEAPAATTEASAPRNHLELVAADSSAWSTLLTARLADLCQQQGIRLETPEDPARVADSLQLTLGATELAQRPRWRIEGAFRSGRRQVPELRWIEAGEGWEALPELTRTVARRLAQARGEAAATDEGLAAGPELRSARPVAEVLAELETAAGAEPSRRLLLLGELSESCLRDPSGLALLFAPGVGAAASGGGADEGAEAGAASSSGSNPMPDCPWLRLRVIAARSRPEAAQLLDELLLPRGVDAQLVDPAPSQALLCWALTLPGRADRRDHPGAWLRRELAGALNRRMDPTAQPHWAALRGQLRTGLLLADRLAGARSPFCVELRRALAESSDGDDLLLTFAIALHHLDPVPDELRQQSADALWQARELWDSQPGFRPYLQALAVDIAAGLPPAAAGQLPEPLPQGGLSAELLLPALMGLDAAAESGQEGR